VTDDLLDGYRRFRGEVWPRERERFETLAARGQSPHTMVVCCSDSRADPQRIFGAAPGELFVLRNVANLVPPYAPDGAYHGTSAALEFGVRALGVGQVVVMGHALCGGVRALLEGAPAEAPDFVEPWMRIAEPARRIALRCEPGGARQECCEHETVRLSIRNLMTFPWIAEGVAAGRLRIRGFHFGIRSGALREIGVDGAGTTIAP
jgi:carbonic anhydrase